MSNAAKVALTIVAAAIAALLSAFVPDPYKMPVLAAYTSVCLHYGISFGPTASAAKKAPGVPPLAMLVIVLTLLLVPFAIFCSACGLFGSGGAAAPVAKCAPSPRELLSEVGLVLLQGGDFAATEAALERLAGEYTESTVDCAVAVLVDEWTNPSAKADDAHLAGAARGRAHLAAK